MNIKGFTGSLLKLSGIVLCLVSLIFTIKLTVSMASSDFDKILMGVYGFGIEVCKWIFVPIGIVLLYNKRKMMGAACLATGLAVTFVSIFASIGFLNAQNKQSSRDASIQSPEYATISSQIKNKQTQINFLHEKMNKDSSSNFTLVRASADGTIEDIQSLEKQQIALISKLKSIDTSEYTSSGALFVGISNLINKPAKQIELIAFVVTSVLVEICGMLALVLTMFNIKDNTFSTNIRTVKKGRPNINTSLEDGNHDTGTSTGRNNRYIEACDKVKKGMVNPSFRSLKKHFNVGDDTARRYIRNMLNESIIKKQGRGYRIA